MPAKSKVTPHAPIEPDEPVDVDAWEVEDANACLQVCIAIFERGILTGSLCIPLDNGLCMCHCRGYPTPPPPPPPPPTRRQWRRHIPH